MYQQLVQHIYIYVELIAINRTSDLADKFE